MPLDREEYDRRLAEVEYNAGMNARYHQILEAKYDRYDKAVRVMVAIGAIIGTVFAVPKFEEIFPDSSRLAVALTGFVIAVLSLAAAAILNIVPIAEKAKFHGEMFRSWSDLRKDAVLAEHKTCAIEPTDFHADRLFELVGKAESLHAQEPFPDEALLRECQDDENRKRGLGKYVKPTDDAVQPCST